MSKFIKYIYILLTFDFFRLLLKIDGFNLDIDTPIFKIGPPDSYFGYSVAGHFLRDKNNPMLLVGAPRGESGQIGTQRAGAMYACPVNRHTRNSTSLSKNWCDYVKVEFDDEHLNEYNEAPNEKEYFNRKRDQLLGSVISSGGTPTSRVLVCAPNLIFDVHAYMDGQCYLLQNDLAQYKTIRTCQSWPKQKRHNEWGSCQEGFSGALREDFDLLVTGLPGAKRWVGGANVQEIENFNYQRFTTKAKGDKAVEDYIAAHSYLGYSVGIGLFGFSHEEKGQHGNFTVVTGAPRYNETGAIFFLPFAKSRTVSDFDELLLLNDHYKLTGGDDFASSFGYSLTIIDIDNNKFDDLIVGAPNYFDASPSNPNGGAVFIYFSSGKKQTSTSNDAVFEKPYKLLGPKSSQFGTAIAGVDITGDGFNDIVIGAPYDQKGGAVYIYLGSYFAEFDVKPSQIIYAHELRYNPLGNELTTFGWSLYGGADLDDSKYPDLIVGAYNSSAVILLRAKPVINFHATIDDVNLQPIDKDQQQRCRLPTAKACFQVTTILSVEQNIGVDWRKNFICRLEVLPSERQGLIRAQFDDATSKREWPCRFSSPAVQLKMDHELFIMESNRDWLNPIHMKYSVHLDGKTPPSPSEGGAMISLSDYPVIAKKGSEKKFQVEFDNKCGPDRKCNADLNLKCVFADLAKDDTGVYIKDVGKDDNVDVTYVVTNNAERAYETIMYVEYDDSLVELPQIIKGSVNQGKREAGIIEYFLANPMLNTTEISFTLRFSLIRGGGGGLKISSKPLNFASFVNTTSTDVEDSNNNCSMDVRVVTRAELDLQGYTTPRNRQLLYGGKVIGESAIEFFSDIGDEVQHIYELKNEGPWSVPNVTIIVDFPYEVNSTFEHGKWALYITDPPSVRVVNPGNDEYLPTKKCEIDYEQDFVDPLKLKDEIIVVNNVNSRISRLKRSPDTRRTPIEAASTDQQVDRKLVIGRTSRELRIKPVETALGEKKVTIDCFGEPERRTAKCVRIKCQVSNLANNGNATVTIVSRLWNSTFVEDYRDVNKVEIISRARIEVDKRLGIQENDYANNEAEAITEAYPDLPAIPEKHEIPVWIIILAVFGGIFLLFCIIILLWKCGFFNRNRHADQPLYKAEYKHNDEFDT